MADSPPYPGTPRWVKVFGIIAIVLLLFVLLSVFTGGGLHGPGRHASSGEANGYTGWGRLMLLCFLIVGRGAQLGLARRHGYRPVPSGKLRHRPAMALAVRRRPSRNDHDAPPPQVRARRARRVVSRLARRSGRFPRSRRCWSDQPDAQTARAAYIANGFIAWYVILPLLLAALLIGVVQSLGTSWGLFCHYWVLAKFLLTVLTIIVLLLQMEGISYMASVAAETTLSSADLLGLRHSLRLHAAGGLLVLLVTTTLSVYKPRGMTRYGWRRQHRQPALSQP